MSAATLVYEHRSKEKGAAVHCDAFMAPLSIRVNVRDYACGGSMFFTIPVLRSHGTEYFFSIFSRKVGPEL